MDVRTGGMTEELQLPYCPTLSCGTIEGENKHVKREVEIAMFSRENICVFLCVFFT